jgi:hypothetical protein
MFVVYSTFSKNQDLEGLNQSIFKEEKKNGGSTVLGCFIFFGRDELTPADFPVSQLPAFIKGQPDFDPLEAKFAAHQGFVDYVTTAIGQAQVIMQIKAGLDDLTAATTADVNKVAGIVGLAAGKDCF